MEIDVRTGELGISGPVGVWLSHWHFGSIIDSNKSVLAKRSDIIENQIEGLKSEEEFNLNARRQSGQDEKIPSCKNPALNISSDS